MTTAFFTVYDKFAKEMAKGMVRSVKKFYPEISFLEFEANRDDDKAFDLKAYCSLIQQRGTELLKCYDRIIYIDPDHIMCNECPDLFGDFDLGVVRNNITVGEEYGGVNDKTYLNNGMVACTSKEAWQDYTDDFEKRNNEGFASLNHQNALNAVAHSLKYRVKLLEFPDKAYGISCNFYYGDMYVFEGDLYIDVPAMPTPLKKKLCLFHAAGEGFKVDNHLKFDWIKNSEARELLESYTL